MYEYDVGNARAVVKGRLKAYIRFWQDIGAPQWVLDTIRHGYVIPFTSLPTRILLDSYRSAYRNSDFVSEAISELLDLGVVHGLHDPPAVVTFHPLRAQVFQSPHQGQSCLNVYRQHECGYHFS